MIRYISRYNTNIDLGSINIDLGAMMSKSEYLKLADTIAAEIADGTLKPGDRLPPQRNFASDRKIAVSTAARVYPELLRRGPKWRLDRVTSSRFQGKIRLPNRAVPPRPSSQQRVIIL
jgi:DNA-binding transcriptional MocR family regulator